MRLLLVTTDFPPDVGGTQTYASALAGRFARTCEHFAVVAPCMDGCEAVDAALPFDVIRVRSSPDAMVARGMPHLLRLVRHRRFDTLFHVQWSTAAAGLTLRALTGVERVFVAVHGREVLLHPLPRAPLCQIYSTVRRNVLCHADGLFPVSRFTASLLRRLGVSDARMFVAPGGVDAERFCPCDATDLRRRLDLEGRRVILSISRLVPRKGVDDVIRSLPCVLRHVPDVVYLIGGSGPDRGRLEHLAALHEVGSHVRFLGRIPDETLPAYYNLCDVFAMPARSMPPDVEGFGLVFLEAAACGKAAVGSFQGGIPDAVIDRQTGTLVEAGRPVDLAATLAQLLIDRTLARSYGENARRRVVSTATWDQAAARILRGMQVFGCELQTDVLSPATLDIDQFASRSFS